MRDSSTRLVWVMTAVAFAVLFAVPAAGVARSWAAPGSGHLSVAGHAETGDGIGVPAATTIAPGSPPNNPVTIPHWSSSFTYNGTTYPFTMVGTDPSTDSQTTTVPVEIIPISLTYSNGVTLDGTTEVTNVLNSPVFQSASFTSGTTQFGDAMQRAEFWNDVSTVSPGYHVLLGTPTVLPTQTYSVPLGQGFEFTGSHSGQPIGLVNYYWFAQKVSNLPGGLRISPTVIPIFLTFDTFLYIRTTSNCCILGFHGATVSTNGQGRQHLNTFIWASYNNPGIFSTIPGYAPIEDITALSHEVSELFNDPFVGNLVPAWSVPSEPQYGCSNLLEVGDPLVGYDYTVNGYHPQDIAFLPWFDRAPTSTSIGGQYTYLGTYTTFSPFC